MSKKRIEELEERTHFDSVQIADGQTQWKMKRELSFVVVVDSS